MWSSSPSRLKVILTLVSAKYMGCRYDTLWRKPCVESSTLCPAAARIIMESPLATSVPQDIWLDVMMGDWACNLPGATETFLLHGLAFCCGGTTLLRAVLGAQGLDIGQLIVELAALPDNGDSPDGDWCDLSTDQVIEHSLSRFHHRHRQHWPDLIRPSRRVESVHAEHAECTGVWWTTSGR